MQRAWLQRVRQQQAWVQRQLRLERQVWERRVRFREVRQGEARRVQRQHRLERQVLAQWVRFREVPRGEVRRVPVLHQQVRQGVARRAGQRQLEWNALIDKYIDDSFEDDDGRSMCDDLSGDAVSTCLSVCACLSVRASLSVCQAMHSYTCKYVSDVVNYISMSVTSNEIILNHTRVNTRMSSRILLWTESLLPSPGRCLQSSHAHTRARICHVLKVCVGGCVGG